VLAIILLPVYQSSAVEDGYCEMVGVINFLLQEYIACIGV